MRHVRPLRSKVRAWAIVIGFRSRVNRVTIVREMAACFPGFFNKLRQGVPASFDDWKFAAVMAVSLFEPREQLPSVNIHPPVTSPSSRCWMNIVSKNVPFWEIVIQDLSRANTESANVAGSVASVVCRSHARPLQRQ